LPALLLPLTGTLDAGQAAASYMDRFLLLMMAGFMAALAIERWGLHRRLALAILLRVGASPRRLVLGMTLATALPSMVISNTAATLIMLPIGLALLSRLEEDIPDRAEFARFGAALCLAIAYGASIGGMGTPLGTPPNLIYLGAVAQHFGRTTSFVAWMRFALPIVLLMIAFLQLYFVKVVRLPSTATGHGREVLHAELAALGPMSPEERRVAGVFVGMVVLWITREVDLGGGQIVGWASMLGLGRSVDDSTVALLGTTLLFVWPAPTRPEERLLDWATAVRIPWDVVLLFGGGLALAKGFEVSGLSRAIGGGLTGLVGVHPLVVMLVINTVVTFLTEVTSNTAITTLLMPILAPFAKRAGFPPEAVLLPAALSASCAFMLPVATAPNAIVYGSGRIPIAFMARTGLALNVAGVVIITAALWLFG
jgi:sodium-dependent dicarboxylate transporter 2/3/5